MSFIKITSNIRPKEGEALNLLRIKNASIVNRIQKMALRVMKQRAPVATGKFRNSIKIINSQKRQSEGIFKGFVTIKATAPNSRYIVRRTSASQGAYVPALKKRIQFGQHPGTSANHFIVASRTEILQKAQAIVNDHYRRGSFDVRRFIR